MRGLARVLVMIGAALAPVVASASTAAPKARIRVIELPSEVHNAPKTIPEIMRDQPFVRYERRVRPIVLRRFVPTPDPSQGRGSSHEARLTAEVEASLSSPAAPSSNASLGEYDGEGRRIAKHGEDGLRLYAYDDTSILAEYNEFGTEVAKYDYGADRLIRLTRAEGAVIPAQAGIHTLYYSFDGLGSVTSLTSPTGTVAATYHLDAWGNYRFTAELAPSRNRFGYTGHYWDNEAGLYYAKARFYDPFTARFTQSDSFLGNIDDPPSLHRYLYGHANPTMFVDPSGYSAEQASSNADSQGAPDETVEEPKGWFAKKWDTIKEWKVQFVEAVSEKVRGLFPEQKRNEARDKEVEAAFADDEIAKAIAQRNIGEGFKKTTDEVVREGAAQTFDAVGTYGGNKVAGVAIGGLKQLSKAAASVWTKDERLRGLLIEKDLAKTAYKDWYHVGKTQNGWFPLVDFQRGKTLVSLKSVDTSGTHWMRTMQDHIDDLATRKATVRGRSATMVLDLRVQPGGAKAAESLVKYGQTQNITVVVSEYH